MFGVLNFSLKFGASIIKGLILSFQVKVISKAVSSITEIDILKDLCLEWKIFTIVGGWPDVKVI